MLENTTHTYTDEHPLGLLLACHEKVKSFCRLLRKLGAYVDEHGANDEASLAATSILRYFELALPNHHADEEEDVFPALRRLLDLTLTASLDKQLNEHVALDMLWSDVYPWLKQVEKQGVPRPCPDSIDAFVKGYMSHVKEEEEVIFPAIDFLPPETVSAIAKAMRTRRGA